MHVGFLIYLITTLLWGASLLFNSNADVNRGIQQQDVFLLEMDSYIRVRSSDRIVAIQAAIRLSENSKNSYENSNSVVSELSGKLKKQKCSESFPIQVYDRPARKWSFVQLLIVTTLCFLTMPFLPFGTYLLRGIIFEIQEFLFQDIPASVFAHDPESSKAYFNAREYKKYMYQNGVAITHLVLLFEEHKDDMYLYSDF